MPEPETLIPVGKLPQKELVELLGRVGSSAPEVLVGPCGGEDAAVIEVHAGALVVAADPVTLTAAEGGAIAVIVNANDVAVTGARPRWFLATVLLPPGTDRGEVEEIFASMNQV